MGAKQLSYADEARQKLLAGVSKLARAVRSTLGPRGRNAILDKGWGSPTVTKDGVSVAEDIDLKCPYENMGAQLVKEAASKTSDVAGDGTTTATVLAEFIYREGLKAVAAGSDPMAITRGIQKGVDAIVENLKAAAKKIDPNDEKAITEVATIAANNDKEIGSKLAEAMKKVGATNGVITIEEGKTADTEVHVVQGMQFDRGYLSPHFVTNQEDVTCEFENPYILILEDKISNVKDLVPLLETFFKKNEPLLIIAEDIEGEALATLVLNKLKGILKVAAVKAPGYGDRRKAMLEDLAVLTGGKAIFKDLGFQLDKIQLEDLGRCKKVRLDSENTTITEGAGDKKAIEGRAESIRKEISKTDSEYDREKLQERLAKLAGGVAQLKVGGATETAMKERKALYEDSLHATRAALAEGTVVGGGVALLNSRKAIESLKLTGDEEAGARVLYRALEMPCRMIAENAGKDGTVVVAHIRRKNDENWGYNADADRYEDMRAAGIIDPVKVTRSALQNGASVAMLLLTTETIVADIPEPKKDHDHDHHHDHGGGGMGGMGGMPGMDMM
ncbi:chaperonin GroEL [Zavarzinella formosa]|uniref:chaperonin GroEL n=1 Tax=Zavarzinella formosa TaxID=360055 RepID=UPI0002FF384E|nr:chaperonin GroEL [Zavarzinella formosa]